MSWFLMGKSRTGSSGTMLREGKAKVALRLPADTGSKVMGNFAIVGKPWWIGATTAKIPPTLGMGEEV